MVRRFHFTGLCLKAVISHGLVRRFWDNQAKVGVLWLEIVRIPPLLSLIL